MDPLAENHHGFTPYNYVLGNPIKYADFMGLDTISRSDNVTPVKANDVRQTDNGDYTTASQGEITVTGNVNQRVAYFDDYINPPQNTNTSMVGSVALGLRAGPIGAAVVGAVALTTIIGNLPSNLPPAPGFGDPSKWHYTYRPPSLDPINNPPQGFDPNETPKGVKGAVGVIVTGKLLYELYDTYKEHIESMKPIAQDNTRQKNPEIRKPKR